MKDIPTYVLNNYIPSDILIPNQTINLYTHSSVIREFLFAGYLSSSTYDQSLKPIYYPKYQPLA